MLRRIWNWLNGRTMSSFSDRRDQDYGKLHGKYFH